jgi:hypothetical protein
MPHQDWFFLQPFRKQLRVLEAFERIFNGLEILFSGILVPPYVLSLFDEDVHFFHDFLKLRFQIIPDIKV